MNTGQRVASGLVLVMASLAAGARAAGAQVLSGMESAGLYGGSVRAVAIDRTSGQGGQGFPGRTYLLVEGAQELFYSDAPAEIDADGDQVWHGAHSVGNYGDAWVVVDQRDGTVFELVAEQQQTSNGFFKSTDGGITWDDAATPGGPGPLPGYLGMDDSNGLLVGRGGILYRGDGDTAYQPIFEQPDLHRILEVRSYAGSSILYVVAERTSQAPPGEIVAESRLYRGIAASGGNTYAWEFIDVKASEPGFNSAACDPRSCVAGSDPATHVVYLGGRGVTMYRSDNGGTSFLSLAGFPGGVGQIFVDATGRVFAAPHYSDDLGDTWHQFPAPATGSALRFIMLVEDTASRVGRRAAGQILYGATDRGIARRSGTSDFDPWIEIVEGLDALNVAALRVSTPATETGDFTIYAGGEGGVYRSDDSGGSWERTPGFRAGFPIVTALGLNPLDPLEVYAATNVIGHSTDGGQTLDLSTSMIDQSADFMAFAGLDSGPFFLASVKRQEDGGGVYFTTAPPGNWQRHPETAPLSVNDVVIGLAAAEQRSTPRRLLAAVGNRGIPRSERKEFGVRLLDLTAGTPPEQLSWVTATGAVGNQVILSVARSGATPELAFAAGGDVLDAASSINKIYRSTDAGSSWTEVPSQLSGAEQCEAATIDDTNGEVYFGCGSNIYAMAFAATALPAVPRYAGPNGLRVQALAVVPPAASSWRDLRPVRFFAATMNGLYVADVSASKVPAATGFAVLSLIAGIAFAARRGGRRIRAAR
ncbi:MAG: hypothetical protein HYV63_10405 [Candidatus Schekmanbacteria bacterium]|nr:hypothetical protein [Candidatus Schekmanbacteria bacterium]